MKRLVIILTVLGLALVSCNKDSLKGTQWDRTVNFAQKENNVQKSYIMYHRMELDSKTTGTMAHQLTLVEGSSENKDTVISADTVTLTYDYDSENGEGTINWQGDICHFTVSGKILTMSDKYSTLGADSTTKPFNQINK